MMEESCVARLLRRMAETALRMREPARRFAGSLRSTVVLAAVLMGAYNFSVGSVYLSDMWRFYHASPGLMASAGTLAVVSALGDLAIIFAILRKKDEFLHWILCAALAVYFIFPGMSIAVIINTILSYHAEYMFWEILRIISYPQYMCLLYCLLVELRDSASEPDNGGWLKSNMASQEPSALGDGLLLKVEKIAPAPAPATFAPSSCVTAAPVHAALRGAAPAPAPASGPLSSSEA